MGTERDEILNVIQNGFFNEGIYRISEERVENPAEIIIPLTSKKEQGELNKPPEHKISVAEESEHNILLPKKEDEYIDKPEPGLSVLVEQEQEPEYFGGNKQGVAILVMYPDERWIYFKDKIILERILASVKLTFDDVALINTNFYKPESLEELTKSFNISKIIGFGINDPFLKGLKREEPVKLPKTAVFLMNSDLDEIAMNVGAKRLLWNNLKLMFNI
jgi:hypothetical protein